MANTNPRPKERGENDLIGNILTDEGSVDFFNLRMEMGKSISAPPPGLLNPLVSQSPDVTRERVDMTATEDYYNYYHSLKPHDPRLPLPKWKPAYHVPQGFQDIHHENQGIDLGLRKGQQGEGYGGNMNNFANQFDNLNMGDNSQSPGYKQQSPLYQEGKSIHPRPVDQQYNTPQSPDRKPGYNPNQSGGGWRNQQGQGQHQGGQQQQQHYNKQGQQQHQNYPNQGQQRGGQGQERHHGGHREHQGQGHQGKQQGQHRQQQQQQYGHQQGQMGGFGGNPGQQYYQGMDQQQQQYYYNQPYMNPQMQMPMQMGMQPQPYYGMNNFQPQMYPQYGMDPNMQNPNQKQFGKMQGQQYGGNQMGDMQQMGGMNQYYNQPYGGGNYQQQGFQQGGFNQQQQQGNFQQGGFNQSQNRGQKPTGKNFGGGNPKLDIKNVLANLIENCKDQNGSRLIQQHFEKSTEQEKEQMFQQILPHASDLMTDVFGNYVIQKILDHGSLEQKIRLFGVMKGKINELSRHTYGCRVVQRILEELRGNGPVQDEILDELSDDIVELIEDQNGNHVIQKCLETMPADKVQFIIQEVTTNINTLAFHPYGCRVIQRILEHSPPETSAPMLSNLMSKALECCESQYGNYIMQYILEKGPQQEKLILLDVLKNNFVRLSMNKFASNVTEKSAVHGTPDFRRDVVDVLCTTYHDNRLSLVILITHSFANYVVQRMFECSDEFTRRTLYNAMQGGNLEEIKKTNYGKHVLAFIEKLMAGQK